MNTATTLLVSSLLLFSCSGDASASPDQNPVEEGDATGDENANEKPFELTDKMVEEYIEVAKQMKSAGSAGSTALLEKWLKVSEQMTKAQVSATRVHMSDLESASRANSDKQIAALEARLKTAPEAERDALQTQLEGLKQGRVASSDMGSVSELDRRNAEVLARWKTRLEAAGQ